jgi:hypothetical protein
MYSLGDDLGHTQKHAWMIWAIPKNITTGQEDDQDDAKAV